MARTLNDILKGVLIDIRDLLMIIFPKNYKLTNLLISLRAFSPPPLAKSTAPISLLRRSVMHLLRGRDRSKNTLLALISLYPRSGLRSLTA